MKERQKEFNGILYSSINKNEITQKLFKDGKNKNKNFDLIEMEKEDLLKLPASNISSLHLSAVFIKHALKPDLICSCFTS